MTDLLSACIASVLSVLSVLPADKNPSTGTDTVGSSEAVLLGGLALKRRWQERRKKAGLDVSKPNIVMGTETHVVGLCCQGGVKGGGHASLLQAVLWWVSKPNIAMGIETHVVGGTSC